jgi:hypothetical protein
VPAIVDVEFCRWHNQKSNKKNKIIKYPRGVPNGFLIIAGANSKIIIKYPNVFVFIDF